MGKSKKKKISKNDEEPEDEVTFDDIGELKGSKVLIPNISILRGCQTKRE